LGGGRPNRRPHRCPGVQDHDPPRHPSPIQNMEHPSLNRGYTYVILSN
jgi:hypothetical protein